MVVFSQYCTWVHLVRTYNQSFVKINTGNRLSGVLQKIEKEGVVLSTGDFVPCDVVVGCIGFKRSNTLCETLTGRSEVKTTNYLDQDMMYLADAEIDEGQGIGELACSFRCRVIVKTRLGCRFQLFLPFNYS